MGVVESPAHERSIAELFGELASETGTLVRQEVSLASTELFQKAGFAGRQALYVLIGALMGSVALLLLAGALVLVLANVMREWQAALIVGVAIGLVAFLILRASITAFKTMDMKLTESIASLKGDKSWAKRQIQ